MKKQFLFATLILILTSFFASCTRQQQPGQKVEETAAEKPVYRHPAPDKTPIPPDLDFTSRDTLQDGENFNKIMKRNQVPNAQTMAVSMLLSRATNLRRLPVGTSMELITSDSGLVRLVLTPPKSAFAFWVDRLDSMKFIVFKDTLELDSIPVSFSGTINSTLYDAFLESGATPAVAVQYIEVFQFVHYFSSETRKGDKFKLFIDMVEREGEFIGYGHIHAAQYIMKHDTLTAVRYPASSLSGAGGEFFDANGDCYRRELLRVPFPAARVTSTYGLRKHPISGNVKMHYGVDLAAKNGTPVVAAGDGVIVKAVKGDSGLGNWLQIKHNRTGFATRYGHLRSFAKGIKKGVTVKQGQKIGYVGQSGYATGPHLHYEVFRDGERVNPLKTRGAPVQRITGEPLNDFLKHYYTPWYSKLLNIGRLQVDSEITDSTNHVDRGENHVEISSEQK